MTETEIDTDAPQPKAKNSKSWPRHPDEWYVEPQASTAFLLARETFRGVSWDPCCGGGNIVRALLDAGLPAIGTDIRTRAPGSAWFKGERDFINGDPATFPRANNIIFNPPFFRGKGSEACIIQALGLPVEKVAAFLPMRFLFGERRAPRFWIGREPSRIWPVYPRPSCPPGDFLERGGEAKGGTDDFVWVVWDRGTSGGYSRFRWAPPEKAP